MYTLIVGTLLAVVMATPVYAQVHVDIGIHFPAPPPLVVVSETPQVQYVPTAPAMPADPANLFFYNGQYWAFVNGGWHVGRDTTARGSSSLPNSSLALSCSYQRGTTMPRLDTGSSGKPANLRAGMRSMGVSGPTSASGEGTNTSERTNKARIGGTATGETDRLTSAVVSTSAGARASRNRVHSLL